MFEARVTKLAVIPEKGTTVLYGVAEYGNDMMNFRAPYQFESMDHKLFLEELREKIAEEFDVPVYHVVMNDDVVLGKMLSWHERFNKMGLV